MSTLSDHGESATVTFFISRAGAQADIAKQIGSILEDVGHSTILQDWDFHDQNFLERMQALKAGNLTTLTGVPRQPLLHRRMDQRDGGRPVEQE